MGDHGPTGNNIGRLQLGQYENLNPFLMVVIPAVYRNTSIHAELRKKTHQLMTNFDLHATLMDILKLQPHVNFTDTSYRDMMPLSKGSSLLREWIGPRNCLTLPIPSEYCICQYNRTEIKRVELKEMLGRYLAKHLNSYLIKQNLGGKCQAQHYNQAFIRRSNAGFEMSSGFIRLDSYGRQGDCLEGNPNKPLCHCMGATTP
ncbi:hypothetical protein ANCDUO_03364 [Ancylostoma duodenale]|uniref:Uncharacterized protein n=1 Tax=Ancylostoma duodenale TaxID=51022 RepID=A0A0C2H454_9BILA|nr:hypothetical protein ANCDUO_03364 [Ancylostoma duodenale]